MASISVDYRPASWNEVVGHSSIVRSICQTLKAGGAHAFLLSGPSGVGKTTIARLIASQLEAIDGYIELDAASRTGVDDIRLLQQSIRVAPMGGGPRVICLDEAHMLSKSAWSALLKDVEEPPTDVYWIFCTTEVDKVPSSIRTRCQSYDLGELSSSNLYSLLQTVCEKEKISLTPEVRDDLVKFAGGSARMMLQGLSMVRSAASPHDAASLLSVVEHDNADVAEFCRALLGTPTFSSMAAILSKMDNVPPETIRQVTLSWFSKVAMGAKTDKQAERAVAVLEAFSWEYPTTKSNWPVLISLGKLFFRD